MSKRSRAAALHSELEEYASLVRALRTSKTLDLASHLTQYSQNQTQQSTSDHGSAQHSASDYEDDTEEDLNDLPRTSSAPPTSDVYDEDGEEEIDYDIGTANNKGKRRASFKARGANKQNERDTWTRWPLLSGDVHIPTWGLDDEVAALSTNILRMQRQQETQHLSTSLPASSTSLATQNPGAASELNSTGGEENFDDIDDDLEADDEKLILSHLATSTAFTLSRLLSTLAQYVPPVEKSLRNRLAPLDWSAVLRAAKAGNLGLDTSSIERLERRLVSLYGPANVAQIILDSASEAVPYQQQAERIKILTAHYDAEECGLLTFYGPPLPSQPAKSRKRRREIP